MLGRRRRRYAIALSTEVVPKSCAPRRLWLVRPSGVGRRAISASSFLHFAHADVWIVALVLAGFHVLC